MNPNEPPSSDELEDTIDVVPADPEETAVYSPKGSTDPSLTKGLPPQSDAEVPERIGRYQVRKVLGEGGFGRVYLAEDVELHREVAIKVPHKQSFDELSDVEGFLDEARILANLDHGHIVPVYDVGRTEDGQCYIVSKFVDGVSLRDRMRDERPSYPDTARLLARVSEALHYAHEKGVVHRDIKPDNILLDQRETPFLADFGLALKDEELGTGPGFVGTAYYMSPEQARGEGHLVDGRSDLFSLGVVLYYLITGERPFTGKSVTSIMKRILDEDPVYPRHVSESIPRELERICMKALAKRILDRYESAGELAEELRAFAESMSGDGDLAPGLSDSGRDFSMSFSMDGPSMIGSIVPRGLQSFEEEDADFFLQLLPGAVDRTGLPPVVRFWKSRIEETNPAKLLRVGLLYGPSGCGKSSVVRAGLIPRLSEDVESVLVVATANETEARLIEEIRLRFPEADHSNNLAETLLAVRRADIAEGRRLLIVIDQFEQWLQVHNDDDDDSDFVLAMRQCDGLRVQTLLLVRDEFWMSIIGFLRQLDITLEEGKNSKAVDLFEVPHARKVLTAFGRAYETLPPFPSQLEEEQTQFIEAAVDELAEDGRVAPVRLSLFAEMMRRREWTPDSLQKLGGAEGVGIAFLDECFRSDQAPPEYRQHRQAAREILGSLLPVAGQKIRAHRRTIQELAAVSGYERESEEFGTVMRILCEDLRLLSAVDPLGQDRDEPSEPHYELTHDYLVPSLRTWLERERRETRRGRTQILLERRSDFWNARPERKQLPTMLETLRISFFTNSEHRTESQARMMRVARRVHGIRATIGGTIIAGLVFVSTATLDHLAAQSDIRATDAQIGRLLVAEPDRILQEIPDEDHWAGRLRQIAAEESRPLSEKIRAWLALLAEDKSVASELAGVLNQVSLEEHAIIIQALADVSDPPASVADVSDPPASVIEEKLRSRTLSLADALKFAGGLAQLRPTSEVWDEIDQPVSEALLEISTGEVDYWTQMLAPVSDHLKPHLERRFDDERASPANRQFSSTVLAMLLRDEPKPLVDLAIRGDSSQLRELVKSLQSHREAGIEFLKEIEAPLLDRPSLAGPGLRRLLSSTVIRFQLGDRSPLWSRLKMSANPSLRSELILNLQEYGIPPRVLLDQLKQETRPSCQQALLLALGEYSRDTFDERDLAQAIDDIRKLTESPQTTGGAYSAGTWLLRAWGADPLELEPVPYNETDERQWWLDSGGHIMVVVPYAESFRMGSPSYEPGRTALEDQRQIPLPYRLAVSTREVSVHQFRQFVQWHFVDGHVCPNDDCPVTVASWYDAIRYCRWLSEQEGIPEEEMVYPSLEDLDLDALHEEGATVPESLARLSDDRLARTGYRLPTSAEWEYICRAGAQTRFNFGDQDTIMFRFAWTATSPNGGGSRSLEVGSLLPNAWGLFDMAGNVGEWTHDGPLDESETGDRVALGGYYLRGGSFKSVTREVRCADLAASAPRTRYSFTGFRIVRTLTRSE